MLIDFIKAAMRRANYKILDDDGTFSVQYLKLRVPGVMPPLLKSAETILNLLSKIGF